MKKYIAIVDSKAGQDFKHYELLSGNLLGAIKEASKLMDGTAYIVFIAEKFGTSWKEESARVEQYNEILSNRGHGWNAEDGDIWLRYQIGHNNPWYGLRLNHR